MNVNFRKIKIEDIEGKEIEVNFAEQLGNQLYMTGKNIIECELGKRIYFTQVDIDLSEQEVQIVKNAVAGWGYVARAAINKAMKE